MGVPLMNNEVLAKVCLVLACLFCAVGLVVFVCSL